MRGSARPHEVALLADELKRVAGWGCGRPGAPQRLARMPVLSKLADTQSLPPNQAGCIILRYLKDAVLALTEDREYLDRVYDAHTLRRALLLELGFEQGHLNAPVRQYRTMQVLGQSYGYHQWRKHHLLQRGLLTLLAESIVQTAKS
jgi:hypothetical protein